ncbi:hypothetical protein MKW92_021188 [Papaver armeniacum]|nr:hypothetical protein MKW92_021188 [Papaver armeniacum]
MAENHKLKDLKWALQVITSESGTLHSISFNLSQAISCCYKETENSMCINISTDKDDVQYFSHLLNVIGEDKNIQKSLTILEFQRVEWEIQQLRNLCAVLQKNLNIKQVVFRRNRFSVEGLWEISEMLKRNRGIKEIIFSESGVGHAGVGLIASALKNNVSLEELQIWDDSIGVKGAEELAKMIEVNTKLKLLIILDSTSMTATPLISAVLARSRVACALGWNSTVKSLDMSGIRLKSRWAKEFRVALEQNRTLKEVNLSNTFLKDKAIVYIAAGLFRNQVLESLSVDGNRFGGVAVEHLLCPLTRFSALQNQANTTLKSVTFGGSKTKIGRRELQPFSR